MRGISHNPIVQSFNVHLSVWPRPESKLSGLAYLFWWWSTLLTYSLPARVGASATFRQSSQVNRFAGIQSPELLSDLDVRCTAVLCTRGCITRRRIILCIVEKWIFFDDSPAVIIEIFVFLRIAPTLINCDSSFCSEHWSKREQAVACSTTRVYLLSGLVSPRGDSYLDSSINWIRI